MSENPLLEYFEKNDGRLILKWMHYFAIYHKHFAPFRHTKPTVVEFGVHHGGSLQMWKHYFGEGARICGIDVNPKCQAVEEDGIEVFIGDQEDRGFLRELAASLGPIQILIDDGGHTMRQQIATFEEMYGAVSAPGIYLVEDLHTSYWKDWGGGIRKRGSFVEYTKRLIDQLSAWHVGRKENGWHIGGKIAVDDFTRSAHSMTYYDSVLVIEKAMIEEPLVRHTGHKSFKKKNKAPRAS